MKHSKSLQTTDGAVNIKKEPMTTEQEGESMSAENKPDCQDKTSEDTFDSLFSGSNTGAAGAKPVEPVETSATPKVSIFKNSEVVCICILYFH